MTPKVKHTGDFVLLCISFVYYDVFKDFYNCIKQFLESRL